MEFLGDLRSVDQDIKALTGMGQPSVPPEIAAKLPGWSLILYYPPSQAIKELKDAGKDIVEHAIKTAKGELPNEGASASASDLGAESVFDKYRRKRQNRMRMSE